MNEKADDLRVVNNEARGRFEIDLDGRYAFADYRITDEGMVLAHTEVPPELQGRGLAAKIVRAVLDHAREQGLAVVPFCSYVAAYIRRHPEYQDLVAPEHRRLLERT